MLNNIEIIVLLSIFVMLLLVIFKPIKSAFNLNTFPSCILSVCVSLLSVMGMFHFLGAGFGPNSVSEKAGGEGTNLDFILLPYAALGITIVLLALYLFGTKLLGNGKPKDSPGHAEDRTESVFQPDPGKWDKPAGGKVGKAYRDVMTIQDNCPCPQPINRLMGKY